MATYTKAKLSASTDGKGVAVAATASPGTTIHTAVSGTSSFDEIWIWASNIDTADLTLTIEYGNTAVADTITLTVPALTGLKHVIPGLILQNGSILRAFAQTANKINLFGFVNQIV